MMITETHLCQILQGPYQRTQWTNVYSFLFKNAALLKVPQKVNINTGNSKIKSFIEIGHVDFANGEKLHLFEVEVSDQINMRQTRVAFNNSIAKILSASAESAAIGIFHNANSSTYRFSFVRKTVSFTEEGELKKEQTNSKRYTYILGQKKTCATAVTRFLKLHDKLTPTLDDVEDAFSVEALTKEFYLKLFDWYQWALSPEMNVHYPDNTNLPEHMIRLITRLMFVWFIKEKDLVPDYLFKVRELNQILKDFNPESTTNGTYYNGILQNLFFATLNSEVASRRFVDEESPKSSATYGVTTLYRDRESGSYFKVSHDEVKKLFCKIPFLNGGLFDCLDKSITNQRGSNQVEYHDGFSREQDRCAFIPNALFFDKNRGLISLLSSYNFTIEESSPDDLQVALDPELLGKVFENLLGSYNPETQTTARNQSGSFYTPREIVSYMVDESLMAALGAADDKDVEKLFDAVGDEDIQLSDAKRKSLCDKIKSLKILDPACGSGAFPMGILNRMVELLTRLNGTGESLYDLKLHLIENCIYGIDIQPIATQISKLRFFISLICESNRKDTEENFGLPTLPNLETKFVAANSLLAKKEQERQGDLFDKREIEKNRDKLLNVRHQLFSARKASDKKKLRAIDKELREKLADLLAENCFCDEKQAKQLAAWNPYDQNASAAFFDTEWMFGMKDGFDIVIGNPPYIQLQNDGGKLADLYKGCGFETFARMGDIYCLFYERGMQLLKDRGSLCYITSNKWMRAGYGEATRNFFANKTNPKLLIDFAGEKIFESATVDTNILLLEKAKNAGKTRSCVAQKGCRNNLSLFIQQYASDCAFKSSGSWVILSPIEQSIKNKIERIGTPLKDWNIQINYGVKTGCNEAFIIDEEKRENILKNCKSEAERKRTDELIRPILRGRDIKRYGYHFAGLYLIASHNGIPEKNIPRVDIEDYPAVKAHLDKYWDKISVRADQGDTPYNLRSCAYMDDFSKQKIVWGNLGLTAGFAHASENMFVNAPCSMITPFNGYLLAILNSKLGDWYIRQLGVTRNGGYFEYKPMFVSQLPVPRLSQAEQSDIIADIKNSPTPEAAELTIFNLYALSEEEQHFILAY